MASGSKFSDDDGVSIVEEEENSMEHSAMRQISTPNKSHIWQPSYGITFEKPVATPSAAFLDCSTRPSFARSLSALLTLQQQRFHTHARRASLPRPLPYKSVTAPSKKTSYEGLEIEDDEVTVNSGKREGFEKMLHPGPKSVLPVESKEKTKTMKGSTGLQKMPGGGVINIATTSVPAIPLLQRTRQPVSPPLATKAARQKVGRIQKHNLPSLNVKRSLISVSQDRNTASPIVKSGNTQINHPPTNIDQYAKASTTAEEAVTFEQDSRYRYYGNIRESIVGISKENKIALNILRRGSFEREGNKRSDEEVERIAFGGLPREPDLHIFEGSTNSMVGANTAQLQGPHLIQDKPELVRYVHREKSTPRSQSSEEVAFDESKNWRPCAPKGHGSRHKQINASENSSQLQSRFPEVQTPNGNRFDNKQTPLESMLPIQPVIEKKVDNRVASPDSSKRWRRNCRKACRTLNRQQRVEQSAARKAVRLVATKTVSSLVKGVHSTNISQPRDTGSPDSEHTSETMPQEHNFEPRGWRLPNSHSGSSETQEIAKTVATVTESSATSYHEMENPKNTGRVDKRKNVVRRIFSEERSILKAIRKTHKGQESSQSQEAAVGVSDMRSASPMKVQQLPPSVNPPCLTVVGSPPPIGSPPLFSRVRFYPSKGTLSQHSFTTLATCSSAPSSDPHLFVAQSTGEYAGNPSIPLQPNNNTHQSDPIVNSMGVDADTTYVPRFHIPDAKLREMMLASPQTGAAYWQYTLYQGPNGEKVKVHYCQSKEASERVAKMFMHEKVLGFDIEWKPQVLATEGIKKNVSLIQLASEERIALFHIARYGKSDDLEDHVAPTLKLLMESPDITKVGVSIKADCTRLRRFMDIQARGLFELSHLYKLVRFSAGNVKKINKWLVALAQQVEEHLQLPMWKGPVRSSDWSSNTQHLTFEQIQYAASDSYAGLQIYNVLEAKRRALNPVPPRPAHAELNLPIRLAYGQTAATYDEDLEFDSKTLVGQESSQGVDVGAITRDFANIAIEDDTPRFSIPKPAKKISRYQSPEALAAEAWVANWRSNLPQNHKLKATPANLRAYALWYDQAIGVEQVAALLRDPPLQHATVAAYVISTVNYENLPFDQARLRDVFGYLPEGSRERFQRLRKACGCC